MNLFKKTKGFTLIELLVVVSAVGLLSSIVLASVAKARQKAQGVFVYQSLLQLRNAIEMYRSTTGNVPGANQNWDVNTYNGANHGFYSASRLGVLVPNFISSIPLPPGHKFSGNNPLYFGYSTYFGYLNSWSCGGVATKDYVLYVTINGGNSNEQGIFYATNIPLLGGSQTIKCITAP
jgi:prepilin-type N-terminal cleavage/methylation domain-containing protein